MNDAGDVGVIDHAHLIASHTGQRMRDRQRYRRNTQPPIINLRISFSQPQQHHPFAAFGRGAQVTLGQITNAFHGQVAQLGWAAQYGVGNDHQLDRLIPTINIQVRNAKLSPIADLINQFRNILPNNNHPGENKKVNKPFYCSQHNTTSVPPFQNVSAREKLVATRYGFNMYVDSNDATVSNLIAISGTWEPEYIQLIGNIVKEGDNVINLGSQSGLEALVMGKIIGSTGRLFIFEPYSFSNQLITKNIELNNLTNITTIYKVGASD